MWSYFSTAYHLLKSGYKHVSAHVRNPHASPDIKFSAFHTCSTKPLITPAFMGANIPLLVFRLTLGILAF